MQFADRLQFSIVTPSFRSSLWLRLCIASVADQGMQLEHIVQDAGSDDGTLDWLPNDSRVKAYIEKDSGMYDAINRGLGRAKGDIIGQLNCDEQYLPGALEVAWRFFEDHPDIEIVFGDMIVVGTRGEFLCSRKVQLPTTYYTRSTGVLSTYTCATFYRRSVLSKYNLWFDPHYRIAGDGEWIIRALENRIPMGLLRKRISTFTLTGNNLMLEEPVRRERQALQRGAPVWLRAMRPLFIAQHRMQRLLNGAYHDVPFTYSIYTTGNPTTRHEFEVTRPTHRWPA